MADIDLSLVTPRPAQKEVIDLVMGPKAGEDKWYAVSPPGSGKTVLGLIIALQLDVPTLVLAPNTAIQMQWVAKSRMFLPEGADDVASIDPDDDAQITVLTYQALARAKGFSEEQRAELIEEWLKELTGESDEESGESDESPEDTLDRETAEQWLNDYEEQNGERFDTALLRRWKRKRLGSEDGGAQDLVDDSALDLMKQIGRNGTKLLIFDECHHLIGYWAQVALALVDQLDSPRVLAFTATPPSASELTNREIELHKALLDEIDYAMPTPAVVRDGCLAPYQDLVFLTRPLERELEYVRTCSDKLSHVLALVEDGKSTTLSEWILSELSSVPDSGLASALRRRERFFGNAVNYLRKCNCTLPPRFAHIAEEELDLDQYADLIGRFASRALMVSKKSEDRSRFEELKRAFRPLGYNLTDSGLRRCQSTVSRVIALSEAKMEAMVDILKSELEASGSLVHALVICDFEKSSATVDKDISHLLTSESGGAIAAMRALTADPVTDELDPILVTGQTVLVDDDLLPAFVEYAGKWFSDRNLTAEITPHEETGFYRIEGSGRDWNVRTYVAMITAMLEDSVTRCLVGTRGLLGEGWDALAVNTLVDLTIAATEMTVNQLRGRAIRLNPAEPEKVANIWDVVCLAPEYEKGLSDYHRLARKHSRYYGICDDGAIEYGLGHIHPALTEAGPEDVALNAHVLNGEMLLRCADRAKIRAQWKIGTPYKNTKIPTLEIKADALFGKFARRAGSIYDIKASEALKNMCMAVVDSLKEGGAFETDDIVLEVTERSDGYYRIQLHTESERDRHYVALSIRELFAPISEQRYIIPRMECTLQHNWFTKLLPEVMHRYVCRKNDHIAIYHPVPDVLGASKRKAELFTKHWNIHVSEGEAVYTKRGKGEEILMKARPKSQSVMAARSKLKQVWR